MGFVDEAHQSGSLLGKHPWWVAVTATRFVDGMRYKLPARAAILLGGIMGLVWFEVSETCA